MLVTDMPLWEDCPFRGAFPKTIEIRRGLNDGVDFVAFWDATFQQHVDVPAAYLESSVGRGEKLKAIKRNMRYFREHPELLMENA